MKDQGPEEYKVSFNKKKIVSNAFNHEEIRAKEGALKAEMRAMRGRLTSEKEELIKEMEKRRALLKEARIKTGIDAKEEDERKRRKERDERHTREVSQGHQDSTFPSICSTFPECALQVNPRLRHPCGQQVFCVNLSTFFLRASSSWDGSTYGRPLQLNLNVS
jgi:hypothetical protein